MAVKPMTGAAATTDLRRNDRVVLDVLIDGDRPLRAYEVLDRVQSQGIKAPPQVYRALNRLIRIGLVHRIESLNAFVACAHHDHKGRDGVDGSVFLICQSCGDALELDARPSTLLAEAVAVPDQFKVDQVVVEIRGWCADCAPRD